MAKIRGRHSHSWPVRPAKEQISRKRVALFQYKVRDTGKFLVKPRITTCYNTDNLDKGRELQEQASYLSKRRTILKKKDSSVHKTIGQP